MCLTGGLGGLKALLADGKKSIDRYMQATFLDQKKNEALLSLLGMNGKAIALNKEEIDRRQRVFSISHPMTSFNITIATKNLNGVLPSAFLPQHLLAWLTGTALILHTCCSVPDVHSHA